MFPTITRSFSLLLFAALVLGFAFSQSVADPLNNEKELWDRYPDTFIIPSAKEDYLTREKLLDNLPYLRSLGFTINRNFVWYSEETTINSTADGGYEWSYYWEAPPNIEFKAIGLLFVPDVTLRVFKYDDCFISQVCGNYSRAIDNPPAPVISGYKWNDLNGNGVKDEGEPGLAGWTIRLAKENGGEWSTPTDVNGYFQFSIDADADDGLTPGTYNLREDNQNGWIPTYAPSSIPVREGVLNQNFPDRNFGNFKYGIIRGTKWNDMNQDGDRDDGVDPGLGGWTIQLFKAGQASVFRTATTD
ncbi:MAG: SdrD B-like domain-containing protein, partial [Armatimonadota bacterium]